MLCCIVGYYISICHIVLCYISEAIHCSCISCIIYMLLCATCCCVTFTMLCALYRISLTLWHICSIRIVCTHTRTIIYFFVCYIHLVSWILHRASCILHCVPYSILHLVSYMLHLISCVLYLQPDVYVCYIHVKVKCTTCASVSEGSSLPSQEMPRHGVPPNAITVTAALRALGRSGGTREIKSVLRNSDIANWRADHSRGLDSAPSWI